ncbi:MAG TPA: class I SAM-dependent methyltransferase [Polyangia bacterium]
MDRPAPPAGGEAPPVAAASWQSQTLARFAQHRAAWNDNPALRSLYERWYQEVRRRLPDRSLGRWIELGSGPGFARDVIPELELSDVVRAPWHDHEVDAEALPFAAGSVGALVLFDVLHHLPRPAVFLAEATRVLVRGGRLVLCEPYVSPLSYPIYRFFHEERCDLGVDPLGDARTSGSDPFDGNQAIPSLLLGRHRRALAQRFPELELVEVTRLAGPSYPASGGFSRRPLLPLPIWRALQSFEDRLPRAVFRLLGFRVLAVLQRR